MTITYLLCMVLCLTTVYGEFHSEKISKGLKETLKQGPATEIIISFSTGIDAVLEEIDGIQFPDRTSKLVALTDALIENSDTSQANVRSFLMEQQETFFLDPLWVQDQLYVSGDEISQDLIQQLTEFPEVTEIIENELTVYREPLEGSNYVYQDPPTPWGIEMIRVQEALDTLHNVSTGEEIRVATIDSGVRVTHESLRDNYLGEFGWFDPVFRSAEPNDVNGHGTHTTGTLAGGKGIGVFPDGKWLACMGCESAVGFCSIYAMIRCGQWVLCPTPVNGDESLKDCSKAPHVVSNSYGVTDDAMWFEGVVASWHVGGLIPVFSNGNSGPACETTGYPARGNVISVASTTDVDGLSSFSSRGPADRGYFKPTIAAPGSNVLSASHEGDDLYRSLSGTSMACPHAAGVASILKAFNPDITYDEIMQAFAAGAVTDLNEPVSTCGGIPSDTFPNHHFGAGRIDAYASLVHVIGKKRG